MVEYVGAAYAGFQRQPGKVTVQEVLERAACAVTKEPVTVIGSGRTDAGAHAWQQVIAFSTHSLLSAETLRRAMNAHLPRDIALVSSREVHEGFHPRHDALSRRYRYLIFNRGIRSPFWDGRAAHIAAPLDERGMNAAAQELTGEHDFTAFTPSVHRGSRRRIMHSALCRREEHLVILELAGSGFMRQMVRSIAGTLVLVGKGKLSTADFRAILESRDRSKAGRTLPAAGLYLVRVDYPAENIAMVTDTGTLSVPVTN